MKLTKLTKRYALITNHFHSGQILIIGIIFMAVILILSASLFSRVANYIRFGSNDIMREQANSLAEAGADFALWKLNALAGSCGSGGTQWCNIETTIGTTGTFEVSVQDKSSTLKTVTSTGYVPSKANPRAKRTVKLDTVMNTNVISFSYALQTDTGGMDFNSNGVVNGNVYTNGSINGQSNSRINGNAYAHGTISSPDPRITGIKQEGAPIKDMPAFNAQYWKDQANINNDPTPGNLSFTVDGNLGPRKIQGDLTISNNAHVTLNGPVYVTGNFNIKNNAQLKLNDSFGSNGTVVLVDGSIQFNDNAVVNSTSATPKGYIMFVSTKPPPGNSITLDSNGKAGALYALTGYISVNSNAQAVAMTANKIIMDSNAMITYDQGLATEGYSSGPGGSWQIKKGTYRFTN